MNQLCFMSSPETIETLFSFFNDNNSADEILSV